MNLWEWAEVERAKSAPRRGVIRLAREISRVAPYAAKAARMADGLPAYDPIAGEFEGQHWREHPAWRKSS